MASYFKRKKSPFFYLRFKKSDGTWSECATNVRIAAPGSIRKIHALVNEHSSSEQVYREHSGSLWDQWVPAFLTRQYSGTTLQRYGAAWSALRVYLETFNIIGPGDVTYRLCVEYPDWRIRVDRKIMRPCKWNTAITEVKVFSAILQQSVRLGMIQANPCVRLGLKRRDVKRKPEITCEEQMLIEKLLQAEPEWMRDCFMVAMRQGFRLSETAVPLGSIDLRLGVISVVGKGLKTHTAPMHPDLRPLYERAVSARRDRLVELPKYAAKRWHQWFKKHGLGLSFHSTRVTVVTRLARSGSSKAQTQAFVGHASETVHDVYTRLSAPDVRHLCVALNSPSAETQDVP